MLITILVAVLIYHCIAYAMRAFEEYRLWELQLTEKQSILAGVGVSVIDLADELHHVGDALKKITANTGAIHIQGQDIFTKADADALNSVIGPAQSYAKRFRNFPTITRWRFWGWDIGVAAAMTLIALLFAYSLLPTGHELFCQGA